MAADLHVLIVQVSLREKMSATSPPTLINLIKHLYTRNSLIIETSIDRDNGHIGANRVRAEHLEESLRNRR